MKYAVREQSSSNNYLSYLNLLEGTGALKGSLEKTVFDYKKIAQDILLNCTFMNYCTAIEKEMLYKSIRIKHFHQGQVIYKRNQKCAEIFIVLNGVIRLGWNAEDGKQIIHRFIPTGILLNIIYGIPDVQLEHDYIAHEATIVAAISGEVFQSILKQNGQVLYAVFQMICRRTRLLDNDIYHQNAQSLRVQLARQLIYLIEYFSSQNDSLIKLDLKISQENFAELLKISRQSIRKELQWFIDEGIIETRYSQIYIKDMEKLKAIF